MNILGFEDDRTIDFFGRGRVPSGGWKFVITSGEDREPRAHVFAGIKHFPVVCQVTGDSSGPGFLGAGRGEGRNVGWDSESCRESLGFDRPTDSAEADRLLGEFQAALRKLFGLELQMCAYPMDPKMADSLTN